MKLLLVEDDPAMQTTLQRTLSRRGMQVVACGDGARALERWRATVPDVVVLDLSLPGLDGLQVLEQARAQQMRTPVLILTARGAVGDRILGLNTGADDYLAKPFDLDELEARLRALVRRMGRDGDLRCGLLRYEPDSRAFYCGERPVDLSPREADLLKRLMSRVDHVVPKEDLRNAVFGDDDGVQPDAVEVIVHRLRKKIAGAKAEIMTLRGVGYLLCDDASSAAQRAAR